MGRPRKRASEGAVHGDVVPRAGEGRPVFVALYLMALLSGAAALIYEIAWAGMLALTFGSTPLSSAAVIAGFMGGLGLGALLYDKLGRRTSRPLVTYAFLEFGIAASTALLTMTMYRLPGLFAGV